MGELALGLPAYAEGTHPRLRRRSLQEIHALTAGAPFLEKLQFPA
jgi:hypothetical protein